MFQAFTPSALFLRLVYSFGNGFSVDCGLSIRCILHPSLFIANGLWLLGSGFVSKKLYN